MTNRKYGWTKCMASLITYRRWVTMRAGQLIDHSAFNTWRPVALSRYLRRLYWLWHYVFIAHGQRQNASGEWFTALDCSDILLFRICTIEDDLNVTLMSAVIYNFVWKNFVFEWRIHVGLIFRCCCLRNECKYITTNSYIIAMRHAA